MQNSSTLLIFVPSHAHVPYPLNFTSLSQNIPVSIFQSPFHILSGHAFHTFKRITIFRNSIPGERVEVPNFTQDQFFFQKFHSVVNSKQLLSFNTKHWTKSPQILHLDAHAAHLKLFTYQYSLFNSSPNNVLNLAQVQLSRLQRFAHQIWKPYNSTHYAQNLQLFSHQPTLYMPNR